MLTQTLISRFKSVPAGRGGGVIAAAMLTASLVSTHAVAADFDEAGQPYRPGMHGWSLVEHDDGQAIELTRRSGDGALSTVCSNGQCNVFVEPDSACMPGSKYPVLMNSARQMGVLTGVCRLVRDETGARLVVHLQQKATLFQAMARGDDLSLAFPTVGGEMDVIEVSMRGVMPLLQVAVSHRSSGVARADNGQARNPVTGKPGKGYRQARNDESQSAVDVAVRDSKTRYHL